MQFKGILIFIIICIALNTHAQENETSPESSLHHRVSLIFSHTHIPAVNKEGGDKKTFIVASLGVNYELWLNRKWAVGLHNDLLMQSFNIENKPDGAIIKREFPVVTALVGVYKPWRHWTFFGGPAKEFEKNETFTVIKTGVEYGVQLPKTWEVAVGVDYDTKIRGYDSWLVGIGIGKNFLRK
ncbi:MAG: hypothetical protein ICV51_04205 [Flavisolibacter sp.]|nr:hypothetical protein [Flavisolibacter sp.]MBD0367956.1 hypothetical protein [Flavisolibacter sp.]MBD0374813.1 hypothetical protein [Flavisolibacter sp.]